jgi:hypothetical protein
MRAGPVPVCAGSCAPTWSGSTSPPRPTSSPSAGSPAACVSPTARSIQLFGVDTQAASQLLTTAGQNIERPHSEAAFARICRAAPIPASSGRTTRHRLDYGGDPQANRALHMIAVSRLRYCDRTHAHAARRTADGLNRRASDATSERTDTNNR